MGVLGLVAWGCGACTHSYVYAPDRAPRVTQGSVSKTLGPGERERSYKVEKVRVGEVQRDGSMAWLVPEPAHEAALAEGAPLVGVDAVWMELDTSPSVWQDSGRRGGLSGGGLGLAVTGIFAAVTAGSDDGPSRQDLLSIGGATILYGGVYGFLLGGAVGMGATSGDTDARLSP
jgi:hypothetical protein